jgi:hypothetical protein
MNNMRKRTTQKYPWLFFDPSPAWSVSLLFTLVVVALSIVIFIVYGRISKDPTPDSIAGYIYAILGSIFMFLAALSYTLKRRSRGRRIGALNGSLHWHVGFGIIAMVLLFLHSFGNFNPRSGTYALYGMIALIISGAIGRMLDRMLPRFIAHEVKQALTEQGEDRAEIHTRTIQSIVSYNTQQLRSMNAPQQEKATRSVAAQARSTPQSALPLTTAWDMAYISLEELPQEIAQNEAQYRFVPDRKSELSRPEALMPGVQEHLAELHSVQRALAREEYYRAIIRYWRVGHVALVFITVGLVLWHLEFATTLLIPLIGK